MKKTINIIFVIFIILIGLLLAVLLCNKTFFKNTYIGVNGQEIFIPKYSYFKREAGMTVASFYSLKSKNNLEYEISNYMNDFKYIDNEHTYGYVKNDLLIQSYTVEERGLFRKIYITYDLNIADTLSDIEKEQISVDLSELSEYIGEEISNTKALELLNLIKNNYQIYLSDASENGTKDSTGLYIYFSNNSQNNIDEITKKSIINMIDDYINTREQDKNIGYFTISTDINSEKGQYIFIEKVRGNV